MTAGPARRLCVIGDPVAHSKSPLLQNAMIAALGLPFEYLCKPVTPAELPDFLRQARGGAYAGFNATMPHKEALVPRMDQLDGDGLAFGAVNTVCIRDGKLYGYNTDGQGFLRALGSVGFHPAGKRVLLLGAGGAAKAVALSLVGAGVASLTVCNRSAEKAGKLTGGSDVMSTAPFTPAALRRQAEGADLLVNCTSLGMTGSPAGFESLSFLEGLPPAAPVCDLIYSPAETALLAAARGLGHPAMNGLPLLLHQAILSLEHFAGVTIDPAAMLPILEPLLGGGPGMPLARGPV